MEKMTMDQLWEYIQVLVVTVDKLGNTVGLIYDDEELDLEETKAQLSVVLDAIGLVYFSILAVEKMAAHLFVEESEEFEIV